MINKSVEFLSFEVKEFNSEKRMIKAYGSVFGNEDDHQDIMEKGAFTKTLQEQGDRVRLVVQHDMKKPIGKITEMREDDKGLYFEAKIAETELGNEYLQLMKEGVIDEFSIGYKVVRFTRRAEGGRMLHEVKLFEISALTFASNSEAKLMEVKGVEEVKETVLDRFEHLAKMVGQGQQHKGLELQLEAEVLKLADEYKSATQPIDEITEPEVTAEAKQELFLTELRNALKTN